MVMGIVDENHQVKYLLCLSPYSKVGRLDLCGE
jgi:hypothetical protein